MTTSQPSRRARSSAARATRCRRRSPRPRRRRGRAARDVPSARPLHLIHVAARVGGDRAELVLELVLQVPQPVELELARKGCVQVAREAPLADARLRLDDELFGEGRGNPVSYTHLTLPTIYS